MNLRYSCSIWLAVLFSSFVLIVPVHAQSSPGAEDQYSTEEPSADDEVTTSKRSPIGESPEDVSQQLKAAGRIRRAITRFDPFSPVANRWRRFNDRLNKWIGLDVAIIYSTLYQHATKANQGGGLKDAAGGVLDIIGRWNLIDRNGKNPGYLGFKTKWSHPMFTKIVPTELSNNIGSIWRTASTFNQQTFFVTQLWWEQHLFDDKLTFRLGKVDQSDFFDYYSLDSAKLFFINDAFSDNPTIAYPPPGLGAAISIQPLEILYVTLGMGDVNARASTFEFETFFAEANYFTAAEIGLLPKIKGLGNGNYHFTLWHSDKSEKNQIPSGQGLALTLDQDVEKRVKVFLRYSFSNGDIRDVRQIASAGIGVNAPFGYSEDLFGVAFAWGEPNDRSLRSQSVIEAFYRIQLFPNLQVTPDLQLIINPSNSPQDSFVAVWGIRAYLAF